MPAIFGRMLTIGMKNKKKNIRTVAVSVTGAYHRNKKLPCQDCFAFASGSRKIVAVVSDGAGSAKYGKIGARIVCQTMCDILISLPFVNVEKKVAFALDVARQKLITHRLNKTKSDKSLMDFSATVVGVVCCGKSGLFFHIGDGAALAMAEHSLRTVVSQPENGSSSCETYFYTMDDWKDSLRFTHFSNAQSVFLMTDGVTGFAFKKNFADLENSFICPINDFFMKETSQRKAVRALNNTLSAPMADKLNPDDKTLLWARL